MEKNIESIKVPIVTYMLIWFTNPNKNGSEQSLCSQFYTSLKEAETLAEMLSGSRMILMSTAQNPLPSPNVYWTCVKNYSDSFDLNELTPLSNEMHKLFIEKSIKNC